MARRMSRATAGVLNPGRAIHVSRSGAALRTIGAIILAAAAVGIVAHLGVMLWASHEFTQVESVIALQSDALAAGQGLYYDLNSYPYTVSAYGPIFYSLWAALVKAGAPHYTGGRMISLSPSWCHCGWCGGRLAF